MCVHVHAACTLTPAIDGVAALLTSIDERSELGIFTFFPFIHYSHSLSLPFPFQYTHLTII